VVQMDATFFINLHIVNFMETIICSTVLQGLFCLFFKADFLNCELTLVVF
jgi:hypothetical protein